MALRTKEWFFQITATAIKAGTRYRDGDKPPSATFSDHLESSVFKTEKGDRAKEDADGFEPLNNGHVTLARDEQVKAYIDKPTDRSLAVQPSQVTEVAAGPNITIDDFEGPSMAVTKDGTEEKRNKYLLNFSDEMQDWLESKLGDKFLESLNTTLTESLDPEVEIVVVIDTTSLGSYKITIVDEMTAWYNSFKTANPWYQGGITFEEDGTEQWLTWSRKYALDKGKDKVLLVAFIDESSPSYHSNNIATIASEVPTITYKSDFDEFVSADHPQFEYFKAILYGVPASQSDDNAVFHSHTYKAVTRGIVSAGDFIESPMVVAKGSTLGFMTSSNTYAQATGSADPSGTYDGLVEYGWSEYHDFEPDDITNKLTREEFDNRIQNALFGGERVNTSTVTVVAIMNDNEEISTEFSINTPVAQIPFDQYKDLPNPTSTGDIDLYADGTLYYMTVAQVWGSGNAPDGGAIMTDDHKILFVKD